MMEIVKKSFVFFIIIIVFFFSSFLVGGGREYYLEIGMFTESKESFKTMEGERLMKLKTFIFRVVFFPFFHS